jgi:hypothetical protein
MRDARRQLATATGIGALRVTVGVALAFAPRWFQREEHAETAGSSTDLLTRTVGIRDIAIGLGTAAAAQSGTAAELQRWATVGLLSDVLDVIAGLSSLRSIGKRGLLAAIVPLPVIAGDLWLLSQIQAEVGDHLSDRTR